MRLFVFGIGYSARAVIQRMRPRLEAVWGTTRNPGKFEAIERHGVTPLLFGEEVPGLLVPHPRSGGGGPRNAVEGATTDAAVPGRPLHHAAHGPPPPSRATEEEPAEHALSAALASSDYILVSIAPDESGDPVLNRHRADLARLRPKSVVYLSTVGVYGDYGGAWVDEASECRPVSRRSRQRVEAEAGWRSFAEETGVPVAIIRLSGIYGPGRGPFEKIRRGTARRIVKPDQVFNRIHADDIAAIVKAALLRRADGFFNGTDDEPAPPQDVLAYAAELLGVPPPPEVAFADAELTPMARTFYGENKRVRNERIKRDLGVHLAYPTYREGLAAVLRAEAAGQ